MCSKELEHISKDVSNTAPLCAPREPPIEFVRSNWGVIRERTEPERRLRGRFRTKNRNVTQNIGTKPVLSSSSDGVNSMQVVLIKIWMMNLLSDVRKTRWIMVLSRNYVMSRNFLQFFTFSVFALSPTQWLSWSLIVKPKPWDFLDTSSPSYPALKTLGLWFLNTSLVSPGFQPS